MSTLRLDFQHNGSRPANSREKLMRNTTTRLILTLGLISLHGCAGWNGMVVLL